MRGCPKKNSVWFVQSFGSIVSANRILRDGSSTFSEFWGAVWLSWKVRMLLVTVAMIRRSLKIVCRARVKFGVSPLRIANPLSKDFIAVDRSCWSLSFRTMTQTSGKRQPTKYRTTYHRSVCLNICEPTCWEIASMESRVFFKHSSAVVTEYRPLRRLSCRSSKRSWLIRCLVGKWRLSMKISESTYKV
jgi:hypothetical protein